MEKTHGQLVEKRQHADIYSAGTFHQHLLGWRETGESL